MLENWIQQNRGNLMGYYRCMVCTQRVFKAEKKGFVCSHCIKNGGWKI